MLKYCIIVFSLISVLNSKAQEAKIEIQKSLNWNQAIEGKEIKFNLGISPDSVQSLYNFSIQQGKIIGMELNSSGEFSWTPN